MNLTKEGLARMIDQSLLRPDATEREVVEFCLEAKRYGFGAIAVNPAYLELAADLLKGSGIRLVASISFPLGACTIDVKAFETKDAVRRGADEVDMVLNIGAIKSGRYDVIEREMQALVAAAKGKTTKVILETCFLSEEEIVQTCLIAKKAGVDFVKTSTGFGPAGATVEIVRLMRQTVGSGMGVKAAGGIRTFEDAVAMIRAGADRIGTSSGVAILEGYEQMRKKGHELKERAGKGGDKRVE